MNKYSILITCLLSTLFWNTTFADVSVRGYYRKDGTYVHPYTRSEPHRKTESNLLLDGNKSSGKASTQSEKDKLKTHEKHKSKKKGSHKHKSKNPSKATTGKKDNVLNTPSKAKDTMKNKKKESHKTKAKKAKAKKAKAKKAKAKHAKAKKSKAESKNTTAH